MEKEEEKEEEENNEENNEEKEEENNEEKEEEKKEDKNEEKKEDEREENKEDKSEEKNIDKNEENKEKIKEEKNEDKSIDKKEELMENKNIDNKTDIIAEILEKTHLEEMRNYLGIVTNETIFEYLVLNYYSNEMKEFDISLNELLILGDIPLLKKLNNGKDMDEKVYQTFNTYLFNNSDIIPIFNNKEIEGFIYPKDFLYYIYNCESNQSLTNEEFLISIYKDIDEEKPYGKNRVIYLELNDKNKTLYVKELIEKLNCSIEKKIIIYDPSNNSNLYLISLRTIFRAIAEFQSNKMN